MHIRMKQIQVGVTVPQTPTPSCHLPWVWGNITKIGRTWTVLVDVVELVHYPLLYLYVTTWSHSESSTLITELLEP